MDESTSEIDSHTEAKIYNNIYKLKGDMTLIIVAHRLTTTINADIVYIFDNGQIIESGNPRELLKRESVYRSYWNAALQNDRKTTHGAQNNRSKEEPEKIIKELTKITSERK